MMISLYDSFNHLCEPIKFYKKRTVTNASTAQVTYKTMVYVPSLVNSFI